MAWRPRTPSEAVPDSGLTVDLDLVVQVRARAAAGAAGERDDLTALDALALLHPDLRVMSVFCPAMERVARALPSANLAKAATCG